MTVDTPPSRAQLIRIETDRRPGHEWDELNGKPLPGNGDFSAEPGLFFRFPALTLAASVAVAAAAFFLLAACFPVLWPGFAFDHYLALACRVGLHWSWIG